MSESEIIHETETNTETDTETEFEDGTDAHQSFSQQSRLHIDKDAIAGLPLGQFEGKIILVEHPDDTPAAVAQLAKERVLGFDTESRPSFKAGISYLPSLLQLAGSNAVWLFRLDACGGIPAIFPLLKSDDILKVGVAVRDDVKGLQDRAPFRAGGFVEISEYTRRAGIENTGLRALAAHYLGMRISKGAQVTNWATPRLSKQQIVYAATDAWVSRELYLHLEKIGLV
jgi:ribonuclease D